MTSSLARYPVNFTSTGRGPLSLRPMQWKREMSFWVILVMPRFWIRFRTIWSVFSSWDSSFQWQFIMRMAFLLEYCYICSISIFMPAISCSRSSMHDVLLSKASFTPNAAHIRSWVSGSFNTCLNQVVISVGPIDNCGAWWCAWVVMVGGAGAWGGNGCRRVATVTWRGAVICLNWVADMVRDIASLLRP